MYLLTYLLTIVQCHSHDPMLAILVELLTYVGWTHGNSMYSGVTC